MTQPRMPRCFSVLAVAAMLALTACRSAPAETAGVQSGSLTFVTALAEEERRALTEVLQGFEQSSGIRVTMVQMESQDVVSQLKAKVAAGRMDIDLVAHVLAGVPSWGGALHCPTGAIQSVPTAV